MSEHDDLQINTLHRFAKHSTRLALQEYSHCEVPAGCGGVVIRWYEPSRGAPATIQLLVRGATGEVWLDGSQLATSYVQLAPGPHVVAVHLRATDGDGDGIRVVAVGASYEADDETDLIRGGARWRIATAAPSAAWTEPAFADQAWSVPTLAGPALLDQIPERERWSIDRAVTRGQSVFALPSGDSWLRVAFVAPAGER